MLLLWHISLINIGMGIYLFLILIKKLITSALLIIIIFLLLKLMVWVIHRYQPPTDGTIQLPVHGGLRLA